MKITVIIDNLSHREDLASEHGLSLLLQTPEGRLLFDTGASGQFLQNAQTLGVRIDKVDHLVLSHAHYDHTGGLADFFQVNHEAKVWVKEDFFVGKLKKERYIGVPHWEYPMERFHFLKDKKEILPGILAVTEIPLRFPEDAHFRDFFVEKNNTRTADTFEEELFLMVPEAGLVVSACSHRGLSNILHAGYDASGVMPSKAFGGFHLKDDTTEERNAAAGRWKAAGLTTLYAGHCTGENSLPLLQEFFGSNVTQFGAGDVFEFSP